MCEWFNYLCQILALCVFVLVLRYQWYLRGKPINLTMFKLNSRDHIVQMNVLLDILLHFVR